MRALVSRVFLAGLLILPLMFASPAKADDDFDRNANGLTLNDMRDRTMVGITRDKSALFSVYIGRDGTAAFHHSNGTRATATWEQIDSKIICFTGLVKDKPNERVCKRAPQLGRGLDWMTVTLKTENGKTTYAQENLDEKAGSSQMVYAFDGNVEVDQQSYVTEVAKWAGHLVVGRTLKDKEAWFAIFDSDGGVDFVFGSGKRVKGTYTLTVDTVCIDFPSDPTLNGCRKPTIKDGKIRWASTKDGGATSELVFMKKLEADGPQPAAKLASGGSTFFYPAPDGLRALVKGQDKATLTMWNLEVGDRIGQIRIADRVDAEFSSDGARFGVVTPSGVEIFDSMTGNFLHAISMPASAPPLREMAFVSETEILLGDEAGGLTLMAINTGIVTLSESFGGAAITGLAFNADGQVLVGDISGKLAVIGRDLKPLPGLSAVASGEALNGAMAPDGKSGLVVTSDGQLYRFDLTPGAEKPVSSVRLSGDGAWSVEFDASGRRAVVSLLGRLVQYELPSLTVVADWTIGDQQVWRASYIGGSALVAYTDAVGNLVVHAPDRPNVKAWLADSATMAGPKRQRFADQKSAWNKDNASLTSSRSAAYSKANAAFEQGDCVTFDALQPELRLSERRSDCAQAATLRKARAQFDRAIAALDCDRAAGLMTNTANDQPRIDTCRNDAKAKADRNDFELALSKGDCDALRALEAAVNKPGASDDCAFDKVMKGPSARAMYLAAVKFDTVGDRDRATRLYTEVMTRFAEDDLAIDAANRLTALSDLAKQENVQAAQAAEQAAAVKAAEERASAAERAARDAADEAERERRAREEEARRADQAARDAAAAAASAAAAQPQTLSSCNRVYVGMEFKGGMFGIFRYRVQGMNAYTGSVTIREVDSGGTQEIHCSQVP